MTEIFYEKHDDDAITRSCFSVTTKQNHIVSTCHGTDLSTAVNKLAEKTIRQLSESSWFLDDLVSRNIKVYSKDEFDVARIVMSEACVDDNGATEEKTVGKILDERESSESMAKRYEIIIRTLDTMIEKKSFKNISYLKRVKEFFEDLRKNFIMLPTLVCIQSVNRLQFTWTRKDGLKIIMNITNASAPSMYISFREINPKIEDSPIETNDIFSCKDVLKTFGFYAV